MDVNNDLANIRVELGTIKNELANMKEQFNSNYQFSKVEGEKRNNRIEDLRRELHKLDIFTERINFLESQINASNVHQTKLLESYMKLGNISIMENDIEHIKADIIRQDREFSLWQEQQDQKIDELRKQIFELEVSIRNRIETTNIQNNGFTENFDRVDENIKRLDKEINKLKDSRDGSSKMWIPIICSALVAGITLIANIFMFILK